MGLGFRGWGLGIRVLGFGERRGEIRGKGLEVWGLRCRDQGLGATIRVRGLGVRSSGVFTV